MFRKITLAALLALSGVAGSAVIAAPAIAAETQSVEQQASALLGQYPTGGPELRAALAGLISNSEDLAATAARIILAFGAASAGDSHLAALGDAINGIAAITPAALQAALATAVGGASDPVTAAQYVLDEAPYLASAHQAAAGRGIAVAVADVGVLNPSAAAAIAAIVDASNLPGVKTAYAQQETTIGSINNQSSGRNLLSDSRDTGNKTTSPN
jgi:hypothetical protein